MLFRTTKLCVAYALIRASHVALRTRVFLKLAPLEAHLRVPSWHTLAQPIALHFRAQAGADSDPAESDGLEGEGRAAAACL